MSHLCRYFNNSEEECEKLGLLASSLHSKGFAKDVWAIIFTKPDSKKSETELLILDYIVRNVQGQYLMLLEENLDKLLMFEENLNTL